MLSVDINRAIELLAIEWVRLYKLRPVSTVVGTALLVAVTMLGVNFIEKADREKREKVRLENLDYQSQVQQLDQMESNVRQLLTFVDNQKKTLQETEDAISSLKSEKEKLRPLVETDRAVVEAFFKAQEERTNVNIWRERWIGFGFGVVSSLIASFIWLVAGMLIKARRSKTNSADC